MVINFNLIKKSLFIFFILCLLFILIYNILHFDPILGYDAEAHYSYVDAFLRYLISLHLPTVDESREFLTSTVYNSVINTSNLQKYIN